MDANEKFAALREQVDDSVILDAIEQVMSTDQLDMLCHDLAFELDVDLEDDDEEDEDYDDWPDDDDCDVIISGGSIITKV